MVIQQLRGLTIGAIATLFTADIHDWDSLPVPQTSCPVPGQFAIGPARGEL